MDAEVTFIHSRSNGTFVNNQANRQRLLITLLRVTQTHHLQIYLDQMLQMTNFWAQTIFSCQVAATDNPPDRQQSVSCRLPGK